MHEHATFVGPESPRSSRPSSGLPTDLLDQVRGRVRVLAVLIFVSFAIDPVMFLVRWIVAAVRGEPAPELVYGIDTLLTQLGTLAVSAVLWLAARSRQLSPARLVTVGLIFEVTLSFVIAFTSYRETYAYDGSYPNLTWVPVVIVMFPLILPGPPRRMLLAAIAAGATSPLSVILLDATGEVPLRTDILFNTTIHSAIAIMFAYWGARIVYGLGKQVAAARELGAYRLEERLGQGGMGEVWRARHRMLARPAAIKLIRPRPGSNGMPGVSEEAVRRFEREAQVIAGLSSPHTVHLYDFGVADDGSFYYAMELLNGLDADKLVRRFGPLPAERVVFLWRQMCHSLSEADANGLVHRDIKPANVFLCRYGEDCDFVKVLDFGLVKALHGADDGPQLSGELAVLGTPAFISPEQALGGPLDSRTDIYATGLVAYWLLTGRLLFNADSPTGYLIHHAKTQPVPPSAVSELPIPEALDQLVLACLAKDPADRPQSARELSQRLAAVAGAWTEDRAREWWARHRPEQEASGPAEATEQASLTATA